MLLRRRASSAALERNICWSRWVKTVGGQEQEVVEVGVEVLVFND